jgi:hypothetical protein
MGRPDSDSGGRGVPGAGRSGAAPGRPPASGRPGGGAVGRWRGAAGAGAAAAGRGGAAGAASRSGRRIGRSLPDDVTSRPGGAGGVGRAGVGRGGAGGGMGLAGRSGSGGAAGVASAAAAAGRSAGASPVLGCARVSAGSAAGWGCGAGAVASVPVFAAGAGSAAFLVGAAFFAAALRAGDFFAAALSPSSASAATSAVDLALDASGWRSRTRPSRWARRRTRSACASSIPEECVLTPMPNARQRSRHSLLVSPSSLASSWTLIFAAKFSLDLPFPLLAGATHAPTGANRGPLSSRRPRYRHEHRKARANAPLRSARSLHAARASLQSQAPRPGSVRPSTMDPSGEHTNLTNSLWGLRRRQPTHVRIGGIDYSSSARGSPPPSPGTSTASAAASAAAASSSGSPPTASA